jgi:hypothetical protein
VLQVTSNLEPLRSVGEPWSDKMRTFCCISHVGSLHKKSLFLSTGLFNTGYRIAGDYDFLLRSYKIIRPFYYSELTAKTRIGGISDRKIFAVAREVLKTKLSNETKPKFICFLDYYLMILKYVFRRFLDTVSFTRNPDKQLERTSLI